MKKFIMISIIGLFLLLTLVTVNLITNAVSSGRVIDQSLIKKGIEGTPLEKTTNAEHYYGTEPLIILSGKDQHGQDMIVWMKENGQIIRYVWQKYGVTKEQIAEIVAKNYQMDEEVHITPGIEENKYLWEALYKTKDGNFQYLYFDFFNGELLRSIKLKKTHQ